MKTYRANLFYGNEDGGYIADIPDLEYCSAFGKTPVDVLREVENAKKAWLETARDLGRKIPKPRYRPAIYQLN
jgi:predicted RNase H-like HicB family nuclease